MERNEELISLYNSGISAKDLSIKFNICRRHVYTILKENNVILHIDKKEKNNYCLCCGKESKKTLCCVCYTNLRRLRVKQYAVEYLGGKCNECGWIGDISGFDFHHKEPKEKEFNPNALNLANKSLNVVKEELDKCELLCAICHRKKHSNYTDLIKLNLEYIGKLFKT